jgi:Rhodopirellula transposase DDE domain
MADSAVLADKFAALRPHLDERQWRLYLGSEARARAGESGCTLAAAVAVVAGAAGAARATVMAGAEELASAAEPMPGRARRPGAGRKRLEDKDPGLAAALRELVEASTRGDPMSPLVWTTLSVREIAAELARAGRRCGKDAVARMLHAGGYSLRGNSRTVEGGQHPDRDAQFRYISQNAKEFLAAGDPVISVDTKKKEQIGLFGRPGLTWRPGGDPVRVRDHDFPDQELGKVAPYGIYDVGANTGFVNVGTDHDTAAFAVESIRRWWQAQGAARYPDARRLLLTCDAGGSNGYRNRTWKAGLARLAAGAGLEITVLHFPPGTSKWNQIEHRLFSQITRNWRGRPLTSHEVVISTIAAVTTAAGLTVQAMLDNGTYPDGVKISDAQMKHIEEQVLDRHGFHGEWNYTVRPAPAPPPDPPPAPGPDPAVLASLAAMAGITDLPALTAAVSIPFAAARELRLHQARGKPRAKTSGPAGSLPLAAIVTAAACRLRLGMPDRLLGELLSAGDATISLAARRIIPILEQHGITSQNGTSPRISTLAQLRKHAAARSITITGISGQRPPATPQDDTPELGN